MIGRALLDTSVVRAGFVSSAGASRQVLRAAFLGRITLIATTALLLEYESVLLRPETLEKAGVGAQDAIDLLDALCAVCLPVSVRVRWRPQSQDRDDDLVIDAAVNGLANVIATFNIRHLRAPAARFGIAAELPSDVLRSLS